MTAARLFTVIGLMSGTSMDGIDAAVLQTDGEGVLNAGAHRGIAYPQALRNILLGLPSAEVDVAAIEQSVTDLHAGLVRRLCEAAGVTPAQIDLIGFHGQTIRHDPQHRRSWQLGDGQRLANALGCVVINQFRQNDLDHGGQGAPLAPAYHRALVRSSALPEPVAILNIGGVSNVTLVDGDLLYACDCGPGNALIDDWVSGRYGIAFDEGGHKAAAGRVDAAALAKLLDNPYFSSGGPKSLDRNTFSAQPVAELASEDGAATLTAFTAVAIALEAARLPRVPLAWIVVGGGRHNQQLLRELRTRLTVPVRTAEDVGWSGDAVEAQAFGYLAVRSVLGLPLSWPQTTGVEQAVSGGVRWTPVTKVRAILFDLDGTLLDTAPDMVAALNVLRQQEGLGPLPYAQVQPLVSHGASALIRRGFASAGVAEAEALRRRFLALYAGALAVNTRRYAGVRETLAYLESKSIPWGIVTNKPSALAEPLLEQLGLRSRAATIVCGDTVAERKPHPLPLLHAAAQLGLDPKAIVYVGDAERDVLAARAASMPVYVALYGYIPAAERPHEWPADGWIAHPSDLLAWCRSLLEPA